tara:strand:+ start:1652 stop:2503 length:852 start_codon:yes stop_codon:yes gene_type:complete
MATDFPANPSNGDTHAGFTYNSTTGAWESTASSGGGASVTTSDSAPFSPSDGDLWWDSDGNKMYVYYQDTDSSQWVQATTPGATGPAGPAGSINILTDVDTTTAAPSTNDLLKWNGTNWVPTTPAPGGITHQDTWRLSSNLTGDTIPITTWTNTAANSNFQTTLGSPMTVSGGYFTFPVTGYWRVEFFARVNLTTSDNLNIGIGGALYSSGTLQTFTGLALQTVGDTGYVKTASVATHINVTNTANIKTGFYTSSVTSGNSLIASGSSTDYSYVMFTRLADAV